MFAVVILAVIQVLPQLSADVKQRILAACATRLGSVLQARIHDMDK